MSDNRRIEFVKLLQRARALTHEDKPGPALMGLVAALESERDLWKSACARVEARALTIQANMADTHAREKREEWLRGHSEGMTDADKAIADAVAERDRALEDRDGFEQCMFQSQEEALEAEARQENAERCAAEAIEVLEIVEGFLADEVSYCPVCGGHIHGSDCRLARVLGIGKVAP